MTHEARLIKSLEYQLAQSRQDMAAGVKDVAAVVNRMDEMQRSIAELQAAALDLCERGQK